VTVRTDQGDLVLDNLRSQIVSWRQTGYHYILRQAASNPQFWVQLNGGQADEVFVARRLDGKDVADAAAPTPARRPVDRPIQVAEAPRPIRRLGSTPRLPRLRRSDGRSTCTSSPRSRFRQFATSRRHRASRRLVSPARQASLRPMSLPGSTTANSLLPRWPRLCRLG